MVRVNGKWKSPADWNSAVQAYAAANELGAAEATLKDMTMVHGISPTVGT